MRVVTNRSFIISTLDLYKMIADSGWSMKKVKYDKKLDKFVAEASNPHGETMSKTGPDEKMAVRNLFLAVTRKNHGRSSGFEIMGRWKYHWIDQLAPIAEAYSKAPMYEPKAALAYKLLADDSKQRADVLRNQLNVEETNNPEPYVDAQAMRDDIHKRQKLQVSRAGTDGHPVWTPEQIVNYRIVHDVLGHGVGGSDFSWEGENRATQAHMPLLPEEAQKALFTEAIARPAYAQHYRQYGPMKIALFPEFYEPAQAQEGVYEGQPGVHPSQSVAPTAMPAVKPEKPQDATPAQPALGLLAGVETPTDLILNKKFAGIDPALRDPNEGWESGITPREPNAYEHYDDPLDFGRPGGVADNARLIDTEWSMLPDKRRQEEAIENALRVVLLSPLKDLRWNAIHYQDLSGIKSADPVDYWNHLEKKRQEWNTAHGYDPLVHRPYYKLLPKFESIIYQKDPDQGYDAARKKAKHIFFDWETEEQERIKQEIEGLPEDKQPESYQIEAKVNARLATRLKVYVAEYKKDMDSSQMRLAAEQSPEDRGEALFQMEPQEKPQDHSRYAGFMGTHLKAIAQVSQHSSEILKAALEDVHEHDGAGHHFRAAVMQLGIAGIGPKTCSFAWLLLQPMTSQLATIDTHIMDVLGKKYEGEMNNRDYFCFTPENRVRTYRGWIPISEIEVGDRVLTNAGIFEDVQKVIVRDYSGPLVEVDTPVSTEKIRMTPEHPVLQLVSRHQRSDHKNSCSPHNCRATEPLHQLEWHDATRLTDETYIVSRHMDESQTCDLENMTFGKRPFPLTDEALWIIGLYLAEGSVGDRVLQFSLHEDETEYQSRIIAFFQRVLGLRVAYAAPRDDWHGVQLLIRNADLARVFSSWLGRGAKNKAIPADLLNLPLERLRHVFAGIHAGDGCDATQVLAQTSPILALQITEFLLRDGRMPSNSTWNDGNINHATTHMTRYAPQRTHGNKRGFWNWKGEKLVRTTTTSSTYYEGPVYNLEVEGDHTYVVQNIVVHNCFERELQAGRDAAGYGAMPLGQFQWGMWDNKRTGEGSHQDHSAMRVLDPVDHEQINWQDKERNLKGENWKAPEWWALTEPYRKQVGEEWDEQLAPRQPKNKVPYRVEARFKMAAQLRSPWFTHPYTGERIYGQPGQSLMSHLTTTMGLSTPEVWQLVEEAGKE